MNNHWLIAQFDGHSIYARRIITFNLEQCTVARCGRFMTMEYVKHMQRRITAIMIRNLFYFDVDNEVSNSMNDCSSLH